MKQSRRTFMKSAAVSTLALGMATSPTPRRRSFAQTRVSRSLPYEQYAKHDALGLARLIELGGGVAH